MTRRTLHAPILIAALVGGYLAANPAPRSASQRDVIDIPVSTSSVVVPSGAPATKASERPMGSAATTSPRPVRVRVTAGPTAPAPLRPTAVVRDTPRPSVRAKQTAKPVAKYSPGYSSALSGLASWYATGGPGMYGATHDYVDGAHVSAVVCAFPSGQARCLTVPVVTQCSACRWRKGATLIDLSDDAFAWFGVPLSVGVLRVTVELVG